jgi:hypothetical protein
MNKTKINRALIFSIINYRPVLLIVFYIAVIILETKVLRLMRATVISKKIWGEKKHLLYRCHHWSDKIALLMLRLLKKKGNGRVHLQFGKK